MLRSIITAALRNILRNKTFSIINLIGLSMSMSLGLLIIIIVSEQYSFDNFHQDVDRIYRINTRALRVEGGSELYASTPLAVGRALEEEYTFAEEVVRINIRLRGDVTFGNTNVPISGLFADPSFFTVFNFPLEKGNVATVLAEPKNIVLTAESAEKIFGQIEPIGQTITVGRYGEFVVTGVLKKFTGRTHLSFEALISTSALPVLESQRVVSAGLDDWNNYYTGYVYFKMKEGSNVAEVERALADMAKKHYSGLKLETRDKSYEFVLNPLSEITPGPELSNQMGAGMPVILIIFLTVLSGVVMIMACFNYTNLMLAKSLTRAREIGVRKVVGAQRWQVFAQFIGEAIVFSMIALLFSYLLLQVLKPAFTQLYFAKEFPSDLNENYSIYFYFVVFAATVGLIAGAVPATYLSAFRAARVLKDSGNLKVYSRFTFRKALIVMQFALSVIFIVVILVVYRQVNFMVSKNYSFNEEGIYNVNLKGLEFEKFANEVRRLPGVLSVGGVSHALGTYADRYGDYKRNIGDENFAIRDFTVDDNYISNLGLEFLAGSNFDPALQGEHERHAILNERALQDFGFADPLSAIGQPIYTGDSIMLTIVGVVKDFNFRPLNYQVGPLVLRYNFDDLDILSASIIPSQEKAVIASIESVWKKLDPIHPFEGVMMKQQLDDTYWDGGFLDIIQVVGYISLLAITMACLGILGMSMYATQTRIKEIGVRKVMGASSKQITLLLSRSFLVLIIVGVIIGLPAGYYLGYAFVLDYAYQIEITPLLLLSGVAIVTVLGMFAIGSQTWKAAQTDPARSLRYE
jgi:putative ABC transport system permease protein